MAQEVQGVHPFVRTKGKMKKSIAVRKQIEHLPDVFRQNKHSEEKIEVTVQIIFASREDIRVTHEGFFLDCTMEWDMAYICYQLPIHHLFHLLATKPFYRINSIDLDDFEEEFVETVGGKLKFHSLNNVSIDKEEKIIAILKESALEISVTNSTNVSHEIRRKMDLIFEKGDIILSEVHFENINMLEFDDEILGSFHVSLNGFNDVP